MPKGTVQGVGERQVEWGMKYHQYYKRTLEFSGKKKNSTSSKALTNFYASEINYTGNHHMNLSSIWFTLHCIVKLLFFPNRSQPKQNLKKIKSISKK